MTKKNIKFEKNPCSDNLKNIENLKIEALLNIDERGQILIPKDVRERWGIKSGEKLALISLEKDNEIHCISLIKTDKLSEAIKDLMSPILK